MAKRAKATKVGIDAVAQAAALDTVFGALAHASRRQVLHLLHIRGGAMTSRELAERFDCEWATMSRHFKVLQDAGLVTVSKRGRARVYRLNKARLGAQVRGWLKWLKL